MKENGLLKFQKVNCVGCFFANPDTVLSDKPCCTYGGVLDVDGKQIPAKCLTKRPVAGAKEGVA